MPITINVKMTHFMVFHRARIKAKDLNVEMQGNIIDCVTTTKVFLHHAAILLYFMLYISIYFVAYFCRFLYVNKSSL